MSCMFYNIRQTRKTSNSNVLFSGAHRTNSRQGTDTVKYLQEQLRQEMEDHIRGKTLWFKSHTSTWPTIISVFCVFLILTEGKGNVDKVQERVTRIQQLKEALREETLKSAAANGNSPLCQQVMHIIWNRKREIITDNLENTQTPSPSSEPSPFSMD